MLCYSTNTRPWDCSKVSYFQRYDRNTLVDITRTNFTSQLPFYTKLCSSQFCMRRTKTFYVNKCVYQVYQPGIAKTSKTIITCGHNLVPIFTLFTVNTTTNNSSSFFCGHYYQIFCSLSYCVNVCLTLLKIDHEIASIEHTTLGPFPPAFLLDNNLALNISTTSPTTKNHLDHAYCTMFGDSDAHHGPQKSVT